MLSSLFYRGIKLFAFCYLISKIIISQYAYVRKFVILNHHTCISMCVFSMYLCNYVVNVSTMKVFLPHSHIRNIVPKLRDHIGFLALLFPSLSVILYYRLLPNRADKQVFRSCFFSLQVSNLRVSSLFLTLSSSQLVSPKFPVHLHLSTLLSFPKIHLRSTHCVPNSNHLPPVATRSDFSFPATTK